jgi:hypothetical protein
VEVDVETEVDGAFQNHASLKVGGEMDGGIDMGIGTVNCTVCIPS